MFEFIFGMLQIFYLNIYSHPSRSSGHGLRLRKCEARAASPRKPCGGFIELGLTGLGLGWPAASRPGRHITNQAFRQQVQGQHYLLLLLANQLHIPTPTVNLLTAQMPMPRRRSIVRPVLRGIDRAGLPSRVGASFEGD